MDLSNVFQPDAKFVMEVRNPIDEKPTGATIMLTSSECDAVQQAARKHANAAMERRQNGKSVTVEMQEEALLDQMVATVVSWDWGDNTFGEHDLTFSPENVRALLSEFGWLYAQIAEATGKRANFTGKPRKN